MFFMFDEKLEEEGLITHKETIIDATFVDVPKQRNSRDENKKIKNGDIPEEWKKPENAPKLAQKDADARWVKKNNETHFGYKDHVKCDSDSKLITHYAVLTPPFMTVSAVLFCLMIQTKFFMPTVHIQVRR